MSSGAACSLGTRLGGSLRGKAWRTAKDPSESAVSTTTPEGAGPEVSRGSSGGLPRAGGEPGQGFGSFSSRLPRADGCCSTRGRLWRPGPWRGTTAIAGTSPSAPGDQPFHVKRRPAGARSQNLHRPRPGCGGIATMAGIRPPEANILGFNRPVFCRAKVLRPGAWPPRGRVTQLSLCPPAAAPAGATPRSDPGSRTPARPPRPAVQCAGRPQPNEWPPRPAL
jgi:hypothetical protein